MRTTTPGWSGTTSRSIAVACRLGTQFENNISFRVETADMFAYAVNQ